MKEIRVKDLNTGIVYTSDINNYRTHIKHIVFENDYTKIYVNNG